MRVGGPRLPLPEAGLAGKTRHVRTIVVRSEAVGSWAEGGVAPRSHTEESGLQHDHLPRSEAADGGGWGPSVTSGGTFSDLVVREQGSRFELGCWVRVRGSFVHHYREQLGKQAPESAADGP